MHLIPIEPDAAETPPTTDVRPDTASRRDAIDPADLTPSDPDSNAAPDALSAAPGSGGPAQPAFGLSAPGDHVQSPQASRDAGAAEFVNAGVADPLAQASSTISPNTAQEERETLPPVGHLPIEYIAMAQGRSGMAPELASRKTKRAHG